MLEAESFYDEYIAPSLTTFISHRFEEIGRAYFSILAKKGRLKGVLDIGTYYYDNGAEKKSGKFDVALARKNACDIYEVKYYSDVMKEKEMLKEEEQINRIKGLKINKIGFITVFGTEKKLERSEYIDGKNLFEL